VIFRVLRFFTKQMMDNVESKGSSNIKDTVFEDWNRNSPYGALLSLA
jgi:hypothetical protein